jgi:hypothetical protein
MVSDLIGKELQIPSIPGVGGPIELTLSHAALQGRKVCVAYHKKTTVFSQLSLV